MIVVHVRPEAFDAAAAVAALSALPGAGGVATYLGVVRDSPARPLRGMVLESFPGMTERVLQTLAEEARARFELLGVVLIHRVGLLPVGAPIMLAAAASAHRHAALDACGFLMDRLKTGAPFWKKELFADGTEAWVCATDADDVAAARWMPPAS